MNHTCQHCNTVFWSNSSQRKYCSIGCRSVASRMNKPCKRCGKIIENKHSVSLKNRIYCGRECTKLARRGTRLSDEWRDALSQGRKNSDKCKGPNLYNWKGGEGTALERFRMHNTNRRNKIKLKLDRLFIMSLLVCQESKCFYCNNSMENYKSIEHLTPVAIGGDNQNYNLVWSCKSCNSMKSKKSLEDYAVKTGNISWVDKWEQLYTSALMVIKRYKSMHQLRKISDLKKLEDNPRSITDKSFQKLKKSIKNNPDYFEARPLILSNRTGELVIIAGNQRYEAAVALRHTHVPTFLIPNLTEEREREIIIRDNVNNGEWDHDILSSQWDQIKLEEWGVDVPIEEVDTPQIQEESQAFSSKIVVEHTDPSVLMELYTELEKRDFVCTLK
jgi:hypothetical protein